MSLRVFIQAAIRWFGKAAYSGAQGAGFATNNFPYAIEPVRVAKLSCTMRAP
jgi:hypothetical protein